MMMMVWCYTEDNLRVSFNRCSKLEPDPFPHTFLEFPRILDPGI